MRIGMASDGRRNPGRSRGPGGSGESLRPATVQPLQGFVDSTPKHPRDGPGNLVYA